MRQDAVKSDAAHCEGIALAHARTFALASALLPSEKRRGAFAVYAFCRTADDIVDSTATAESSADAAARLSAYREAAMRALHDTSGSPELRELAWAVRRFSVPRAALESLLSGVGRDLSPVRYRTWTELADYCAAVASSVGEMCAAVFGVAGGSGEHERATRHARTLGLAMQLTNILRDVGEDAARGRCYLPDEDLALFDLARDDVLTGRITDAHDRWSSFMALEIARARGLYREAVPGIALLARDAQRCALACAAGYAEILTAIERGGYDTTARRATVSSWSRGRVFVRSWLRLAPAFPSPSDRSAGRAVTGVLAPGRGR